MRQLIKHCTSRLMLGLGFVAALGLTGCSKDDVTGQCLPDGEYPLIFTATVEGQTDAKAATRATSDNTWAGNEEVAVQVGSEIRRYTAAVDGALTSTTPFYWQSSTEAKIVSAWCASTYSAARPTEMSVQADQSGTGYLESDLLYAGFTPMAYNATKKLTFKHLPVKVVINLTNGTGVTTDAVRDATVTLVNQTLTSGRISYNPPSDVATVAIATSGTDAITPQSTTAASGYFRSMQALLVPQECSEKQFIKITAAGSDYYYTPKTGEATLTAGHQYTYHITVNKNSLSVSLSSSTEWENRGDEEITSKTVAANFYPSVLKTGDYYYSDGTWSDGGNRQYTDGTTAILDIRPVLKNANGAARTVVGIIFYVGDVTSDDALLKADHSSCTHGLVVALQDAGQTLWSTNNESVQAWVSANSAYKTVVNLEERKMCGYSNTKALKEYNSSDNVIINPTLKVLPIDLIDRYAANNQAPISSSGWYFHSIKELTYMCFSDQNRELKGRTMLDIQFSKAGGRKFDWPEFNYWSSTEIAGNPDKASAVNFFHGYEQDPLQPKNQRSWTIRAILAF